jgi:uncharacterized protein YrrD
MQMNMANTRERIDIGADVIGVTGDKVGSVRYVVVRPPEMHITDIVVGTGAILGRDVVVPTSEVDHVADGKVYLSIDKNRLGQYPDYVEVNYQQPPAGWAPPYGFAYPAGGMLWPVGAYYPEPSSVTVNAPPGTVGLSAGMSVESSDGHKVGTIDALDESEPDGNVTGIIVKQGFLFTHDTRIPADCIAGIENDRVRLTLTKDEVQRQFEGKNSS